MSTDNNLIRFPGTEDEDPILDFEDETQPEDAAESVAAPVVEKSVMDFDQFWKEQERESVPFHLYGEDCLLPTSVPAGIVLKLVRLKAEGIQNVPDQDVILMTEHIFGAAQLDKWCLNGMTIDQMGDLVSWALEQYQRFNLVPLEDIRAPVRAVRPTRQVRRATKTQRTRR